LLTGYTVRVTTFSLKLLCRSFDICCLLTVFRDTELALELRVFGRINLLPGILFNNDGLRLTLDAGESGLIPLTPDIFHTKSLKPKEE
jgi:hypothetical protein